MKFELKKAVFPVAGMGTRFLPATKALPKEMFPVVDKPIVHYAYEEAIEAGCTDLIFVTGRNKNAINNHFDHAYELEHMLREKKKYKELEQSKGWLPSAGHIYFTRQMSPMGLGHAVWCARNMIYDEPFGLLLADDMVLSQTPCMQQLANAYEELTEKEGRAVSLIAVMEVPLEQTNRYGILDVEYIEGNIIKAKGLVEKPQPQDAPSRYAIIGRYILHSRIFSYLERQQAGAGGEVQLTDSIAAMGSEVPIYGLLIEGIRYDCGNRLGFIEANIAFALQREDMRDRLLVMMKEMLESNS